MSRIEIVGPKILCRPLKQGKRDGKLFLDAEIFFLEK
jgi:hypothetical protein